ncbi:Lrp/AsnC family transcriptional regulator [Streptomyces sp. NPDC001941]|uniref:Lrp/AsnC family transcriptional regulator n=1 Tax=Streptomyces sp. NPDC001941 TaxID=3154659 RepID=UPI00331D1BFA
MRDPVVLSELDQGLVHALQVAPRASWARLGAVLGADPATLSRRWQRLTEAGAAWISCLPGTAPVGGGPGGLAFVEVDCVHGGAPRAARRLAAQPAVISVEHVTGGRDLLLTVYAPDLAAFARWTTVELGAVEGVTASRTHPVSAVHAEGSRWRLRSLTGEQVRALAAGPAPVARPAAGPLTDLDRRLLELLCRDGRAPYAVLAEESGTSATSVRRRVRRLFDSGAVQARCEVARPLSQWPVATVLWGRAAARDLTARAQAVAGLREVRMCAALTGRANLMVMGWVRSPQDAHRFEVRVAERAPGLEVCDRMITLRPDKLGGQLLDEDGYRTGCVPLAL